MQALLEIDVRRLAPDRLPNLRVPDQLARTREQKMKQRSRLRLEPDDHLTSPQFPGRSVESSSPNRTTEPPKRTFVEPP
jgi:hypothetical protein